MFTLRGAFAPFIMKDIAKYFSSSSQNKFKVMVAGAAGGIGQPLSLLLKMNPLVTQLALYDVAKITPGVAVDLSHMDTRTCVNGYVGDEQLCAAIQCSHVVVIPAGVPRKPGMSRDDLFKTNAGIVYNLAVAVAMYSPCAILAIVTNPVNSTVPVAAWTLCKLGCFDPARILGVTTLDVVRACTFIAEINCVDPQNVCVPVIGGHAGATIIPVLSQSCPPVNLTDQAKIEDLTKRIQEAGTEVVKAKAGGGSATLSTAYATARFVNSILRGLNGEPNIVECTYLYSCVTEASFFANPCVLGRCGVEQNLGYGCLNKYELDLVKKAVPILQKNIKVGRDFVDKTFQYVLLLKHDYKYYQDTKIMTLIRFCKVTNSTKKPYLRE